jgi:23S rRNA (adenine2503-C2)-methyltransferase
MKIRAKAGREDIAVVYIGEMGKGKVIEFVESVQPPFPREEKWVLIVSTLYGCPVRCRFCDAGNHYRGKLTTEDLLAQIDYLITSRFPDRIVPVPKFKIQFARMGEPAFNRNVVDVLRRLPDLYQAPGLLPTISTIAPLGTEEFFRQLLEVKTTLYRERFQLQFSIHTTDAAKRDWLMPVKKWNFDKIAQYGEAFYRPGGRKITLNFALAEDMPVSPEVLQTHFDPHKFLIKITPVNPTFRANQNRIFSHILPDQAGYAVIDRLKEAGYQVILSIGELAENDIGSNCGQHVMNYLREKERIEGGYTYPLKPVCYDAAQ